MSSRVSVFGFLSLERISFRTVPQVHPRPVSSPTQVLAFSIISVHAVYRNSVHFKLVFVSLFSVFFPSTVDC